VARGDADRRSDIDLWVLVEANRAPNQRAANHVREDPQAQRFDGDRYEFDINVEALPGLPTYAENVREAVSGGLIV